MKKSIIYLLFAFITTRAFAQQDAQAEILIKGLSQQYKAYSQVKIEYTFTDYDPQDSIGRTQQGVLLANTTTNKFKISLFNSTTKKLDDEIISNGKINWDYNPKEKVTEINNATLDEVYLYPTQLFSFYERGYGYKYSGEETLNGRLCQIVDLNSHRLGNTYFKIRLYFDKIKKQLYRAIMVDKGFNRYVYTLNTITSNLKTPDTTFTYDKKTHTGVTVVDQR